MSQFLDLQLLRNSLLIQMIGGLMNVSRWLAAGGLLFSMAGAASPAAAQSGEVAGVVADATGGVLPGADVTLTGAALVDRGAYATTVEARERSGSRRRLPVWL